MDDIIVRINKFRDDRDWKKFHTPENLAKSLVLETAELLENFQWDNSYDCENVKEELADIMIYCLLMIDILGIDFKEIINRKIDENEKKYPVEIVKGSSKKYTNYKS